MILSPEKSEPVQHETLRSDDVAQKVLSALLDDAERCDGTLLRAAVDRAYERRKLSVQECATVESALAAAGVRVEEEEEVEDEKEASRPSLIATPQFHSTNFLSEQQERDCGRTIRLYTRLRDAGSSHEFLAKLEQNALAARDRLVTSNARWVWKLVQSIRPCQHLGPDDLFQEGMFGLLRATETYDPDLGFRFRTYATWWIRQTMTRAVSNGDREVRLPVHAIEFWRRIKRVRARLIAEFGRNPTNVELADFLGVDRERLANLIFRIEATTCIEGDAPVDENSTLFSFIPDHDGRTPEQHFAAAQLSEELQNALNGLHPRDAFVIKSRFGLDGAGDGRTLEDIGIQLGVTRERIRQIEFRALKKLRHPSRSRNLSSFLDSFEN